MQSTDRSISIAPLVKMISHDLRGPLANLKNTISLFNSGDLEISQAKMFLGHIEVGVDRSLKLLDDLVEWSLAGTNDKRNQNNRVELNQLIIEVVAYLKNEFESKNITFEYQEGQYNPGRFNRLALWVILKNLLKNAIQFTQNGGTVALRIKQYKKNMIVSIEDTGVGIPERMIDTIFEMGKDNRRLGTNQEKGTGIGLFIAKDLATRNDSRMWLDSTEEGKGSTFKFSIRLFKD